MRKKKKRDPKMTNFLESVAYSTTKEEKQVELSREVDDIAPVIIEDSDFTIFDSPFSMDDLSDYDFTKALEGDEE